ncbi:glutathione S-transferase [Azospirillum picis]|uniref:Glutathione S-transferase n=1 Tax=Azospirillum picis TaxID=488438 RepID=A0ABU0MT33_9PROT|nr:glutathione S-transferase [Azospirillum picis]MBP2302846.1 glutathione S-transferase [Azospirillum picis]MDQ0536649.1 glutathione S-transferase [Azospirillum picis]
MAAPDITLYGTPLSGHAHRVEAFLNILALPYRTVEADAAMRRSAEFRALNPFGEIPVLVDGDRVLADSNAILVYLAERYDAAGQWNPGGADAATSVQRWLSVAAGELRFGPALARILTRWGGPGTLADAQALALRLLDAMERHLADRDWLAAGHPTIADLACYAYVACAPEGGVPLAPYPAVCRWLKRVEAIPRLPPMPGSATADGSGR